MRKPVVSWFFAALVTGLLLFTGFFACAAYGSGTITVLHVNDFHGRVFPYLDKSVNPEIPVGGASYLAEMIKREREKNPDGVILLSAGDMLQGTPVSNLYNGRPVLDFMNLVRFDAMTLGNHEFDWGREALATMLGHAHFPILSANIIDPAGRYLAGVRPYVILERKGFKIAVIGLTTPQTLHMANAKYFKDVTIKAPEEVLPALIKEARGKGARVIILLTHLGFDVDKQLAGAFEGIDVIVGGHSHTAVTEPVAVGKTMVVQAGYNGTHLGVLGLKLDERTGALIGATNTGRLRVVSAGPKDPFDRDVARMADSYGDRIKAKFQEVIGETERDLARSADGESNLGNLITDAMREAAGAEIGVHNSGGIRADIPKGKITMEQVYTVLPFDNVLVSMDLKGDDLLDLFETSSGTGKGMLQVSGARIRYDLRAPAGKRVVEAWIGAAPLNQSKVYRVVTNDFLAAGGDRFSPFRGGAKTVYGGDLRDAVLSYVRRHSPLAGTVDGRLVLEGP